MSKIFLVLFLVLLLGPSTMAGNSYGQEIYKWVDEKGTVHFSDNPTSGFFDPQRKQSSKEGLTEKSVRGLISQIDKAIASMNADQVGDALSDNVSITLNISTGGQKSVLRPSKHEYLTLVKEGWSQSTNYKYNSTNQKISLTGNKALITADIYESMTVQGQTISVTSKEEVTVELINGNPRITKIVGFTRM